MHISGLGGFGPFSLFRKSLKAFFEHDMMTYASALSFQALFSLFPFVIFLIALLGFLGLSDFFDWLREHAALLFPEQAMGQVNLVIDEVQQPQGGLLSFGMIVALWTASVAVRATMNALNVAYGVKERRPAWELYPLSILYTIGIAAMLIFAAALLIIGPQAMHWIAQQVDLEQLFITLWAWLRWPAAILLQILAVAIIYHVGPDVRHQFQLITPGAILAVLGWIATSFAFNYYVRSFANYSATYGSIGAIIVLLLYFFISASVLLFGAEINAVIEKRSLQREAPGKPMPQ